MADDDDDDDDEMTTQVRLLMLVGCVAGGIISRWQRRRVGAGVKRYAARRYRVANSIRSASLLAGSGVLSTAVGCTGALGQGQNITFWYHQGCRSAGFLKNIGFWLGFHLLYSNLMKMMFKY